ncbi:hypothetical protein GGF46_000348 [Coemansia sp. RSA 552]|nr:hypothetical protein GGF46_000348 [Coemansia sp. RSA 552]
MAERARRNLPGIREEDCYGWTYGSVAAVGTPRAGQEYLQSLLRQWRFNVDKLLELPEGMERTAWVGEHLRQVCIELGFYVSQLHLECTEKECPEMCAVATSYYCAAHGQPQLCPAIQYAVHTLDQAGRLVSTSAYAKAADASRPLSSSSSSSHVAETKQYQSMVRRLYRIFAHSYFHHREFFERQESATYLYARFVRLARKYELAPEAQIIIPDLPTTIEPSSVPDSAPSSQKQR